MTSMDLSGATLLSVASHLVTSPRCTLLVQLRPTLSFTSRFPRTGLSLGQNGGIKSARIFSNCGLQYPLRWI